MKDLPKGWKTVPLGSILSPDQITATLEIMRRSVPEMEKTKLLKAYYAQFAQQLKAKGYDPDFLAYAIPYWIGKMAVDDEEKRHRETEDITRGFFRDKRN